MSIARAEIANRLFELEQEIEANGGIITPEEEAEFAALVAAKTDDACRAIVLREMNVEQLELLLREAKALLAIKKQRAEALRAEVTKCMQAAGVTKIKAEDGLYTASWMEGRQGVEVLVEPSDLPAQYQRRVVTVKADTDMVRMALEAGMVPTTQDGRPIARLTKEPFVTIRVNKDKALELRLEQAARGLLR